MKRTHCTAADAGLKRSRAVRSLTEENRSFHKEWEHDYFFVLNKEKALCLLCRQCISVFKSNNLKRHYNAKHSNHVQEYPINSDLRKMYINGTEISFNNRAKLL